jgi:nucleotide-binding universal stress UspA family protein
MSESFVIFISVVAAWSAIGLVLSIVMGRRGHNGFGWLVMGALLGPLGIVMAVDAGRHDEQLRPRTLTERLPVTGGTGPIDVLVGYDGSSEADAAPQAVVDLLGDRLGRLTVATVVPYGGLGEQERDATEGLRQLARRNPGRVTELEVVHGRPSVALRQCATEGGYKLIAVGTRGTGITKALLGSAASELTRESQVPVLLVGSDHPGATTTIMGERHVWAADPKALAHTR